MADGNNIEVAFYPGSFDRENDRECLNWRLYRGGALIKVAIRRFQL